MNDRTFHTLELADFLMMAARHVQTGTGRLRMLELRPSVSQSRIQKELDITSECVDFLAANGRFGLSGLEDPAPIVQKLQIEGTRLEPKQILALERLLSTSQQLRSLIKNAEPPGSYPNLRGIAGTIPDFRRVLADIGGKVLPGGELDDNASAELRSVRKELAERRMRIHRALETILRSQPQAVQEEIITFRNDRFVIPVRTDSRNQIPGVVHGLSSSGQTTFVEPLSIIDQNNDLVRLHEQEGMEISRILLEISDCFRSCLEEIRTAVEILTCLDVSQAKAVLADEFQCARPEISGSDTYEILDARNILLENSLRGTDANPVPISLKLSGGHCVLVISGPNAGGKTVTLKTLGLLSMMMQMGFHVPARKACIPIFNQVFADIGDQQSMAANLSTFTAHLRNIAEMDSCLDPPSLVLLDEVGTGTDPDEGAALAIGIIEHFHSRGATVVASTHYPRLKMWASQTEEVQNASVEFDEVTLKPTYRLIQGIAGASSGIEIARRMRVTEKILSRAASLVDPGYARVREYLSQLKETLDTEEALRAALEDERAAVAKKYAELEGHFEARERERDREFYATLEKVVLDFRNESNQAVRKIKDRIESARLKKTIEGQSEILRRKAVRLSGRQPSHPADAATDVSGPDEDIGVGDRVRILSLDHTGKVEAISDDTFVIAIGSLRYHSGRSDLKKLDSPNQAPAADLSKHEPSVEFSEEEIRELKVIGLTSEDAVDRVDKFLDSAFLAGMDTIRIIHGHGKGILRNAIANLLRGHSQVERFGPAPPEQGGSGATIVELKK